MTDQIQKFLRKLSDKERRVITRLIEMIVLGKLTGLDVKKLQGSQDVFRIRKGDIRIIYRRSDNEVFIIAIERRTKNTYR
ncbi:MAG: type II toxin-antitoxin system mRNA interferase toxin, RelE/StbE family [bacterium]|nr:type II toxin-antitoxin system mRNA interferase toxin, RelE/StbE family [bacterium]